MMATKIPTSPDAWLGRDDTAHALTEAGFRTSAKTLKKVASHDPSLSYRINARRAEYQWGPTLKWRMSLLQYRGGAEAVQHQNAA